MSTMSLKVSPITDAYMAVFSALTDLPCLASSKPSKRVAEAAGVPGVLSRMAGMEPP